MPDGIPLSIVVTDKGTVLFSKGVSWEKCAGIDSEDTAAVSLVKSSRGDIFLLFPEKDKGLAQMRLYAMPRLD